MLLRYKYGAKEGGYSKFILYIFLLIKIFLIKLYMDTTGYSLAFVRSDSINIIVPLV